MSDIKPSSLKVVDLRAELSKRGLPTKGKKDELVARLTEALAASTADESSTTNNEEPTTEEKPQEVVEEKEAAPVVEQQQQQQVTEETTVTTVINEDTTTQETVVEASKEEQLIVKPAEEVIAQPAEELIKKPDEEVIEKPSEEVIEKPAEEVIEKPVEEVVVQTTEQVVEKTEEQIIEKPDEEMIKKPQEQLLEKPDEQLIEKPNEQVIEKPDEQLIEKPKEQLVEKPDEEMIEKPQEQVIKKPDEQVIEAQANDTMEEDVGLKRKRLENDGPAEGEKKLKTDQETTTTTTTTSSEESAAASLYIKGFVRPLIIKHVQELLSKYGTVKRFWMDSIKTHCYVTYETASQAKEAFQQVNGIKFPADTGRLLTVGELTSKQADSLIDYEQNAAEKRIKVDWEGMLARVMAGEPTALTSSSAAEERRVRTVGINQIITKQLAQAQAQQAHSPPTNQSTRSIPLPSPSKPKEISLDDLFRKTKSLPPLYYLPNTDQEAKLKLEKLQQQH